ncbi:MAG: glycoside hydrolase family 5 protein [Sedimentisphaerales bacterium]|nr:glycoside hydrolase family 5 protein [Sedimentisphaerales bacterium]
MLKAVVTSFVICTMLLMLSPVAKAADVFEVNRKLGRGVNIIGYDPIWRSQDRARFQEKHFRLIKEAGFDSVRINLHAFRHMDANNDYQLSPAWFETLDWAVKNALANKLAVILDLHEFNAMGDDPVGRKPLFLAFWKQVSVHFRNAPDSVVFEILNEPCRGVTAELWDQYYHEALAIIRKDNPTRAVILGPPNWNSVDKLNEFKLPEDDRNIIVTVHYYKPMSFTHQGASWTPTYRKKTGVKWPTSEKDKQAVVAEFKKVHDWAQEQKRPIFLGEFGAYDRADMESRVQYTSFVARTAEKFGFSWAYWQFDSDFIVYDIPNDRWVEPIRDALIPR